jgi:hypothetical protein
LGRYGYLTDEAMKLTLKDILKLVGMIAPYLVAIGGAIGVYADAKTERAMLEYRLQVVEKDKDDLKADLKSIKDVLYSIDTKISVFGTQLEERTGR